MTRTRAGIALCAGLLLLALAPSAWASQASLSGSTVTVTANAGEANDVLINLDLEITDAAGITAGPGCTQETPTKVTCGTDFRITQISLGDANDTYFNSFFTMQSQTVDGGAGNDNLRANSLEGSVIDGGDGDDAIRGGSATDRLMGGAGNDTIEGDAGNDTIDGGAGTDTLNGDLPADVQKSGNDQILARDGERDTISCHTGADTVTADAVDVIEEFNCESIDRPAAGGPGTTPGGDQPTGNVAFPTSTRLRTFIRGLRASLTFSEPVEVSLSLTVDARTARRVGLGRRAVTLARARASVLDTSAKRVTLKPSRGLARKLKRVRRRFNATLRVQGTDADGNRVVGEQRVAFRP
jgi:hypothetical protein